MLGQIDILEGILCAKFKAGGRIVHPWDVMRGGRRTSTDDRVGGRVAYVIRFARSSPKTVCLGPLRR